MRFYATAVVILLVLLAAIAACGPGPAGYSQMGTPAAPLTEQVAVDARATLAMWNAEQTATASDVTRRAEATHAAYAVTSTAQAAAAYATATHVAAANATGTAVVAQVTVNAAHLQATRDAYAILNEQRRNNTNAEIDELSVSAASTSVAQQARAQDLTLDRQQTVNQILPWAVGAAGVVLLAIIAYVMALFWKRQQPYVVISSPREQAMAPPTLLVRREYAALTGGAHESDNGPAPAGLLTAGNEPLTTPRWDAFNAWRDSWRVPIGVDAAGRPILLDRRINPHVAILGATGKGKTQGGLWPITASYLGMGMTVMVANARGADFNHFRRHANAHVLPAVGYDEGPDQLAELLTAVMTEAERRDQILADAGALHWTDLESEGGELVLVIDEFTSLATRANADAAKEMWHSLQRLTHEARKYGIYAIFTMTDQTRRAIGGPGATVVNQCVRIAFGVQSPAMARAFIESEDAVGLPPGQFIANTGSGHPVRGAAFHPAPDDVVAYLEARPVQARPLPRPLAAAVGEGSSRPVNGSASQGDLQAAVDASSLRHVDRGALTSLNKVAQFLTGKEGNANADEYRRAARALLEMAQDGDEWARDLLERSSSDVVQEELSRAAHS